MTDIRIRFIKECFVGGERFNVDDVADFPSTDARQLIAMNRAERCDLTDEQIAEAADAAAKEQAEAEAVEKAAQEAAAAEKAEAEAAAKAKADAEAKAAAAEKPKAAGK